MTACETATFAVGKVLIFAKCKYKLEDAMAELSVAEAVEALRLELIEAINKSAGAWMRFSLAPVELTLEVVVTKDVNGKIGWKILEVGGDYSKETTQTVKLTLTPTWITQDGKLTTDWLIAGDNPDGATIGDRG